MRIYLDDERNPKVLPFDHIVRSFDDFVVLISDSEEPISYISFDHDLGLGKNGYDAVKWLCNYDMDYGEAFTEDFTWHVHSANPAGAKNIDAYLRNYFGTIS